MRHNWVVISPDNKIVWAPVLRNGNRFFKQIFIRNRWKAIKFGEYNKVEKLFCHIRHPKERLIRGLSSVIMNYYNPQEFLKLDLSNVKPSLFFLKLFHDDHLYPVSYQFHEFLDRMDTIYIDHPQYSAEELTSKYLKKQGIDLVIDKNPSAYNQTTGNYLEVQNKVRQLLETPHGNKFYKDYIEDWLRLDFELYKKAALNV